MGSIFGSKVFSKSGEGQPFDADYRKDDERERIFALC